MALIKEEIAYNGEVMTYHRLDNFNVDTLTGACSATLYSWTNRIAREKFVLPILERKFNFKRTTDNIIKDAYIAVKQELHWLNAVDG